MSLSSLPSDPKPQKSLPRRDSSVKSKYHFDGEKSKIAITGLKFTEELGGSPKQARVYQEFLESQISYLNSLEVVLSLGNGAQNALVRAFPKKTEPKELTPHQFTELLVHLSQVRSVEEDFLEALQGSDIHQWRDKFFALSQVYPHYISLVGDGIKLPEEVDNFIREFPNNVSKINVASVLIMPIQRLLRIKLLLEQLHKATPNQHPQYKLLNEFLKEVGKIADTINQDMRKFSLQKEKKSLIGLLMALENSKISMQNIIEAVQNTSLDLEMLKSCLSMVEFKKKCGSQVINYFEQSREEITQSIEKEIKQLALKIALVEGDAEQSMRLTQQKDGMRSQLEKLTCFIRLLNQKIRNDYIVCALSELVQHYLAKPGGKDERTAILQAIVKQAQSQHQKENPVILHDVIFFAYKVYHEATQGEYFIKQLKRITKKFVALNSIDPLIQFTKEDAVELFGYVESRLNPPPILIPLLHHYVKRGPPLPPRPNFDLQAYAEKDKSEKCGKSKITNQ